MALCDYCHCYDPFIKCGYCKTPICYMCINNTIYFTLLLKTRSGYNLYCDYCVIRLQYVIKIQYNMDYMILVKKRIFKYCKSKMILYAVLCKFYKTDMLFNMHFKSIKFIL